MNIEFKDVKNIGDLQKVLSKLQLDPKTAINVHYAYDLTSSEDTKNIEGKIRNFQWKFEICNS